MEGKTKVYLAGIGMGSENSMTVEVQQLLKNADCIIGARRLTEGIWQNCFCGRTEGSPQIYSAYKPEEIGSFLEGHPEYKNVVVALSGDSGFYSGAKRLQETLSEYEVRTLPGISSVAYLAAKLGVSWEDAALFSLHGRKQNFIHAVHTHEKIFLLCGGADCGKEICEKLKEFGLEDIVFYIGKQLSYEDETIVKKQGGKLKPEDFDGLSAAFVWNPDPGRAANGHIADEKFIRGNVPMTKEEVRAVSLAKLALTDTSVLYDIGAGTGSVSVEAACSSGNIRVYAIEKKKEAVELLRQNRRKFRCDGMEIVEGTAPEAFDELEPPTHVFIGGSGGNLKKILQAVREKNPAVHIVINAISLETLRDVTEAAEEGLLTEPEFVQISVAKARKLGAYHMMTGQNPVYIVTDRGRREHGTEQES